LSACAAAASALALTACLPGGDGSREGSSSSSSSSSPEPSDSASTDEGGASEESFDAPEQRQLDAATAKKALPTAADLPDTTWRKISWSSDDSEVTYDPAACAAINFTSASADSYRDKHRTVEEFSVFSQSGGNDLLYVSVESFDTPYPLAYFDEAGQDVAECGEYTSAAADGAEATYRASPVPPPSLGERSFGVRVAGADNQDFLYVRSGHTLVTVMRVTDDDTYDERLLQKSAESVLDDLKKDS